MLLLQLLIGGLVLVFLTWLVLMWKITFGEAVKLLKEIQELQDMIDQDLKKRN